MLTQADSRVKVVEAGFDIVPEEGKNIFDVLAEAKPTGFLRIMIRDNNTAYVVLHRETPVENVEVVTVGGQ